MKISNLHYLLSVVSNMRKKEFAGMTFFVTSQCNLRCKYCFNSANLGKDTDLTFHEIELMAEKLPKLNGILYSGGEPLLREDIVEISHLFIKKNQVKGFGIPTNCIDTENIISKVSKLKRISSNLSIVVCCGLDVFSENHDKYKGKGSYAKAIQTIKELVKFRNKEKNIEILLNSVILKNSIQNIFEFLKFASSLNANLHTIEVVRDNKNDFQKLNVKDFETIRNARLLIDELYRKDDIFYRLYRIRSKILTDTQEGILLKNKQWPCNCTAGNTSFVVSAEGDISLCENLPSLGNLRQNNYDPIAIIKRYGEKHFNKIKNHVCDCNHFVYLKDSIEYNFPKLLIKHILKPVFWNNKIWFSK